MQRTTFIQSEIPISSTPMYLRLAGAINVTTGAVCKWETAEQFYARICCQNWLEC